MKKLRAAVVDVLLMTALAALLGYLLAVVKAAPVPRRPTPKRHTVVRPGCYLLKWGSNCTYKILLKEDGSYLSSGNINSSWTSHNAVTIILDPCEFKCNGAWKYEKGVLYLKERLFDPVTSWTEYKMTLEKDTKAEFWQGSIGAEVNVYMTRQPDL